MVSRAKRTTKQKGRQELRVVELFAGVGGFRIGLAGTPDAPKRGYTIVWHNQWEPATKMQHAHDVYRARFPAEKGEETRHTNTDIAEVVKLVEAKTFKIPDHDVLVGGFPCQDYSVARTLSQASGLVGKKGVLWWEIYKILEQKKKENRPVKYVFLENVDRLLKSPASQRGRDFAIMLASLNDLGYAVEWRVVNAADYGMPQRRRRTFILGYLKGTPLHKAMRAEREQWLFSKGTMAHAFPVAKSDIVTPPPLVGTLPEISDTYTGGAFLGAGIAIDRTLMMTKPEPVYSGPFQVLKDILQKESQVPKAFYIPKKDVHRWKYLKGAKKEKRTRKDGKTFYYVEGPIAFPDPITKPARTIITSEGGATPSRFKHVIRTKGGRYRRLTPLELERISMFPDNHTEGQGDAKRAFFMGNALVVGVIERIGKSLRSLT